MNIQAIPPGQHIMLTSHIKLLVFPTEHRVPSQGYALYSITKGSLRPEYATFTRDQLKALRAEGNEPNIITEKLEIVYTGDTTFRGLIGNPEVHFIFQSPILIMEMTYLDGDRKKAIDRSHVHIEDFIENAEFFNNDMIFLVHLSQKYSFSRAIELLRNQLPDSLLAVTGVNLSMFGSGEPVTMLMDSSTWNNNKRRQPGWGWTNDRYRGERGGGRGGGGSFKGNKWGSGRGGYNNNKKGFRTPYYS